MKQRQVYVNGEMVPEEEARISIFDSAVLIGDSVIETARTFHHKLFRWPEHRDRLLRSIKAARMTLRPDDGGTGSGDPEVPGGQPADPGRR